jgi:hypothetical protein
VDLLHLENMVRLLKALREKGYSLTYQDEVSISCEIATSNHEMSQEYAVAKSMINNAGK